MAVTKVKFYTPQGLLFGDTTTQTTAFSNAAIASFLPAYTGNLVALQGSVVTTANITGSYFIGNGSQLSGITGSNVNGTVPLAGTVTINAQPNITSVGTLTSLDIAGNLITSNANIGNNFNVSGDTSLVGNIAVDGWANIDGEANISNSLIVAGTATVGNLSTTGNVEGNNIVITSGGNLWIGNTPFTRTLTVGMPGRAPAPVTVPLSSNNTLTIALAHGGNADVTTT